MLGLLGSRRKLFAPVRLFFLRVGRLQERTEQKVSCSDGSKGSSRVPFLDRRQGGIAIGGRPGACRHYFPGKVPILDRRGLVDPYVLVFLNGKDFVPGG